MTLPTFPTLRPRLLSPRVWATSLGALAALACATPGCKSRSYNEDATGVKGTEVGVGKVNTSLDILTGITPDTPAEDIYLVVGSNSTIRASALLTVVEPVNTRKRRVVDNMHLIFRLSDIKQRVSSPALAQDLLRSLKGTLVFRSPGGTRLPPDVEWTSSMALAPSLGLTPQDMHSNLIKMLDTVTVSNKQLGSAKGCVGREILTHSNNSEIRAVKGYHPPTGMLGLGSDGGAKSVATEACQKFQKGNPGQFNANVSIACNDFSGNKLDDPAPFDCLPTSEVIYSFDNTDGFGARTGKVTMRHAWRVRDALVKEREKATNADVDAWIPVNRLDEDHAVWDRIISFMTGAR